MELERGCRPVEILLVEDNRGDVRLTLEAFREGKIRNHLSVVSDGVKALSFSRREGDYANVPRPDLTLLDLNHPKKHGRDVLAENKGEEHLKRIPIMVLTTSNAEKDILLEIYDLHASCYITKPVDFAQFVTVVKLMEDFWFSIIKLSESADADAQF